MSWNYRIVHDEHGYYITDVFCDEHGDPEIWGERHTVLQGEDFEGLTFNVAKSSEALHKPVLKVVEDHLEEENQA
jgi:hypothetical protein